jgi:hypothetical protein
MFTAELLKSILVRSDHYKQYPEGLEDKSGQPDISIYVINRSLALIILMEHDVRDSTSITIPGQPAS